MFLLFSPSLQNFNYITLLIPKKYMNKKQLTFEDIVNQFKTKVEYEKFLAQCQLTYELKVYRVNTMTNKQALQYYNELEEKYQKGTYHVMATSWHENQRRLFIWLIICFIHLHGEKSLQAETSWQNIADIFFLKDLRLLKYQYMNILKRTGRVNWSEEQDEVLKEAFQKYEKGQWNQIAKQLFFSEKSKQFKSPKHCRQRYNNHLNTEVKKDPWNDDEDLELLTLVKEKGKKWSQLAKLMNVKRTQHQIKNRFNSLIGHTSHKATQQQTISSMIAEYQGKKQESKFAFFNNIIVVKAQQNPKRQQFSNFVRKNSQYQQSQQIQEQKPFEQPINELKVQHVINGGINIIYCGKKGLMGDKSILASIQDKLFASNSVLSDARSDNHWADRQSFLLTPGQSFLGDSSNYEKRFGQLRFRLDSKGSFDKSQFAQSMEFLRPQRSDISQELKILSSSNVDIRTGVHNQFNHDIKELKFQ